MKLFEAGLSVVSLAGFIWVTAYLVPKARREQDTFALVCSLITALVALIGFFVFGIALQS